MGAIDIMRFRDLMDGRSPFKSGHPMSSVRRHRPNLRRCRLLYRCGGVPSATEPALL